MARQLATIEQLSNVRSHDNADALELATVRGWQVVVKLDEFASGDTVVYFEIDSMLDHSDERFAFLAPRGVRTDVRDGFSGHVLRTAKLRGQISQGLVLPVDEFAAEIGDDMTIGRDLTEILGLRKWDPPLPADLSGKALGQRPGSVPKTDAERVQTSTSHRCRPLVGSPRRRSTEHLLRTCWAPRANSVFAHGTSNSLLPDSFNGRLPMS